MSVRIGVDAHVLTGRYQGTRTTLASLLRAVGPKLGNRALLVYADDPDEARAMLGVDAFHYRNLSHVGSLKRLLRLFPQLFATDRVDIGVFQYMAPLKGRHVVFIHDLLPLTHPQLFPLKVRLRTKIFFTLSIWRAAMVLVVSEFTRSEVQKRFRLPPERLRVVLNGPSFTPPIYRQATYEAEQRYIMTVGRIEPRKNVLMLVEAFRKADVSDVRLVVVGAFDPEFSREMIEGERVEVRSSVTDEQLVDLYRGASLFVYPSACEGFGVPLLDATLFGLPVISSNQTSLPEVGSDLAVYFDPTASDAVDTLAGLIAGHFRSAPVPVPTLEQRARQSKRFSWARAADDFLAAIDMVTLADRATGEPR